jgi:holin-like protein
MKAFITILQIALLTLFFLTGNLISKYLHLPIPGGIVGMIILFIMLQLKIIKLEWIERGTSWLLAELILFFIPAAVGVINYQQALGSQWGRILAVIVLSSLTVMIFTGLTAQIIAKRGKDNFGGSPYKNN